MPKPKSDKRLLETASRLQRFTRHELSLLAEKGFTANDGGNYVSAEGVRVEVRPGDDDRLILVLEFPGASEQLECVIKTNKLLPLKMQTACQAEENT